MPRLAVVGSTNVDLTCRAARLPAPGETLPGHSWLLGHGGKGANQAVLAARLGATVTMISAVGDDAFGEQALANYRAHGLDTRHVLTDPSRRTGLAVIVVDDGARNTIVVVPGANLAVSPAHVRAAGDAIRSADLVLAQLETPTDAALEAFRIARAAGARTLLNPAPAAAPPPDELLALTDLCVPNETELLALTGLPADSGALAEAAARALRARCGGAATVLVTLGAQGALALTPHEAWHCPAVPVDAVDPTAAGDAFIGALAVFLAQTNDLRRSVRRAAAVAALTVTRPGAQSSFPPRDEVEAFLSARGLLDG